MIRYKFLSGDVNWKQYGGKFVSKRLNNGDFDYWLVINVINLHDATGDESLDKYGVEILAVAPSQVSSAEIERAIDSCGYNGLNRDDPLAMVDVLADYGIAAHLWDQSGNNIRSLLQAARRESQMINMLFGFYMDRAENRIGQTGWDLIRGQDVREFFAERDNDPE